KVDWSKHMLIAISGGNQRFAARVEINKITYGEKGLDVYWELTNQNPTGNRAAEIVLVNKFDGDITFLQKGSSRSQRIPGTASQSKPEKEDPPESKKPDEAPKKPLKQN